MLKQDSKQPRRLCVADFLPKEGSLPKYLPFFSTEKTEGCLTRADAQALTEQARGNNIEIKEALQGMHFYNVKKRIQGESDFITWSTGETSASAMEGKLKALADNHRLIAWLMESLNTLKKMTDAVANLSEWDYLERIKEWKAEEIEGLRYPKDEEESDSLVKEYLDTLTVEQLSEYLSVEAEASVYGKALSQNGEVNEIYTQYLRAVSHPTVFEKPDKYGDQPALVVTTFELTVPKPEMTEAYEGIMKRYLDLQKQVKAHQARMADWIEQRRMELAQEEKQRILRVKEFEAELSVWKKQQLKTFTNLYIVVPDNLKPIVDRLND